MQVALFTHTVNGGTVGLDVASRLDSPTTIVLCFCSPIYREYPGVLMEIAQQFPKATVAGCSTSGEIHKDRIVDQSISGIVIKFDHSRVRTVTLPIMDSAESHSIGVSLAQQLDGPDFCGCTILSDGLRVNGSALISGFNTKVDPSKVTVSGGLAGDGQAFKSTFTILNGKILESQVTAIGFYGRQLAICCSSRGGWDKFGPERVITKSAGNILYEIDEKPALDLYKEYLGEKAKDLPAAGLLFPLQIRSDPNHGRALVRTILSVDEATKSLIFAGDVPQGHYAQLMRANFERIVDGAANAAENARSSLEVGSTGLATSSDSRAAIAVSCIGRRLVLGARAEEEVEALTASLGRQYSVAGYYSYGELAPHAMGLSCELHNQSMTIMLLAETDKAGGDHGA